MSHTLTCLALFTSLSLAETLQGQTADVPPAARLILSECQARQTREPSPLVGPVLTSTREESACFSYRLNKHRTIRAKPEYQEAEPPRLSLKGFGLKLKVPLR